MSTPAAIRVMLADDQKLFRAGVRALLQALADVRVVAETGDGREALRLAALLRPDVTLLDIMLPRLRRIDTGAWISQAFPRTRVVILSVSADEDSVLKALRAGAVGYLLRAAGPAELEVAVRAAVRGVRFLSPAVSGPAVAAYLERLGSLERLSARLRLVLQLVAKGLTTREIAATLGITAKAADSQLGELMRALQIRDAASLTRYAIRAGLASLDS